MLTALDVNTKLERTVPILKILEETMTMNIAVTLHLGINVCLQEEDAQKREISKTIELVGKEMF